MAFQRGCSLLVVYLGVCCVLSAPSKTLKEPNRTTRPGQRQSKATVTPINATATPRRPAQGHLLWIKNKIAHNHAQSQTKDDGISARTQVPASFLSRRQGLTNK